MTPCLSADGRVRCCSGRRAEFPASGLSRPAGCGRHHRRNRCRQERGAVRVPEGGRRNGVERRDRPPPAPQRPGREAGDRARARRGVLDDDGVVNRKRVGEIVFGDRAKLDFLEKLLHPLVTAEYLRWREQLGELPNPPQVCVTEVPLLDETGGDKRFDKVVVITAPAKLREQRRRVDARRPRPAVAAGQGEGAARRLRLREHRHPRGARCLGRRRDGGVDGVKLATAGLLGSSSPRSPSTCSRPSRAGTSGCGTRSSTRRSSSATPRTTTSSRTSSPR